MKKNHQIDVMLRGWSAELWIKAFQPVQTNTEEIVRYLHEKGVHDYFELVPGNHYQYGEQRLNRALTWMFG